jgi:CHAD domain-containing protein
MGRLTDLVRRATAATPTRASAFARSLALRVIDRAVSTGRRIGDLADAVRPALGAAPPREPTAREAGIDVVLHGDVIETNVPAPRPAEVRRPTTSAPTEVGWTLARHVSATSSAHAAALLDADPWTATGHDAEMLRTIRVASRRLRVLVALFEPSLRPKLARRLRRALRRVGRALGPVREWDVLGAALQARLLATADGAQAAAIEHVLVDVARHRDEARTEARRALDRLDGARLRRDLDQAIGAAIAPFVRLGVEPRSEAWSLLRARIEAAFEAAPIPTQLEDVAAVHAVRIQAKRLRYAYELLGPAFEDAGVRKQLKHVQRVIGDARDGQLVADFVQRHARALQQQGRPHLAAGLGPLLATLRAEADAARERLAPAIAHLDRARILAATQTALGTRPLAVVPDEARRAAATDRTR